MFEHTEPTTAEAGHLQAARMDGDRWPTPPDRIAELVREGSQLALDARADWADEMRTAGLNSLGIAAFAHDPVLAEGVGRLNFLNLLHWINANIQAPASRVSVPSHSETLSVARDLVHRGLDASALDSYRAAASVAWRRWTQVCFELTSDPDELRALLDFSIRSITAYIDDLVAAMACEMRGAREALEHHAEARRGATALLLLDGRPVDHDRAQSQLGYALTGWHLAAIVWTTRPAESTGVDAVTEILVAAASSGHALTVVAGEASRWIWLPTSTTNIDDAGAALSEHSDVRIAVGRPGLGLDGFRRSHFEALTAQRFVHEMGSSRRLVRFDDVRLASLMTADGERADEFVRDTLGNLADADADTIDTLATWIGLKCNTVATSAKLHTHRNTVIRRLAHAEVLLPRPLSENLVAVAAALDLVRWKAA
jgi:DNA-binding PucR family transcriptional regulator